MSFPLARKNKFISASLVTHGFTQQLQDALFFISLKPNNELKTYFNLQGKSPLIPIPPFLHAAAIKFNLSCIFMIFLIKN